MTMAYPLVRLLKSAGIRRKSITLQPQALPLYEEVELAKATLAPVRVWETSRTTLVAAYEAALSQMTRDSASADLNTVLIELDERSQLAILDATALVEAWLASLATRHARRFASLVRSATRIDPWPYIDVQANAEDIAIFLQRMANLITDISNQAKKDVAEVVWRSITNRVPSRTVAKEIAERLQIARNRALFIASDQANKVNAFLTQVRQEEAGIDEFMWETAKDSRVRPEHVALQGRVFKWKEPPSAGLPGTPPRCRCTGRAHIDLSK
jgi:SPP1 gp7 family putative phage head morphogenesis protein